MAGMAGMALGPMLGMVLGMTALAKDTDCGDLIRRIDRMLTMAKLRPQDAAHVRRLREKGFALHSQGRPECIVPLREAAILLGIEKPSK